LTGDSRGPEVGWAAGFAHLHAASSYSMRYGLATPAALAERAKELGMPALALTDRDGLYGAVKHAQACVRADIAPIIGADLALRLPPPEPARPAVVPSLESGRAAAAVLPPESGRPVRVPSLESGLLVAVPSPESGRADATPPWVSGSLVPVPPPEPRSAGSSSPSWPRPRRRAATSAVAKSVAASVSASAAPVSAGPSAAVVSAVGPPRLANEDAARVTVLATSGHWGSLCRLVSAAHRAGGRGAPVVTPDLIAEHATGLVVLLGPASDVGRAVAARQFGLAAAALARWRELVEPVIEIVDHHGPGDTHLAARMLRLAREAGVPAVLTNAVRYLDPDDQPVAQVLDAARQLVPLGRRHLTSRHNRNAQAYLKSTAQMARIAARICAPGPGRRSRPEPDPGFGPGQASGPGPAPETGPGSGHGRDAVCPGPWACLGRCCDPAHELLADTAALARRCFLDPDRDLGLGRLHLPETGARAATRNADTRNAGALAQLSRRCDEGMRRRALSGPAAPRRRHREAARRLEHELAIIAQAGLAAYFLTVAEVVELIRARGIRCAIRGSGAGSLVNYLIGISGIDPLEHGLIMERFLSQGRPGLPDIDLDVESARRIEAYRAIIERYGEERCGCVSMMETYRARSAIRDTAAALGLPPHEIDVIAKSFGHIRARGIRAALDDLPELRASNLAIPQLTSLFQIAEKLDGLPRHIAMHPCGVVLSSATLLDRVPVERSAEGLPLVQFDMDDVEAAGMIKLDVLGVRMQSAMTYTLAEIERTRGERVDIDALSPDDEPTFEMIRSGRTLGCFQIESPGQRELVTRLGPRDVGDLIVDISLFRPGPVNSDMITPFLDIKHGRRPACYPHEDLVEPLGDTGGVVIFHEQVLRVFDAMTGCGFSESERRRRMLSNAETRQEVSDWFHHRAQLRGYDAAVVERVWEVLESFGGFGFCKAHAAAFAIPTYQSAWLKRHYPAAFYAGVLVHDPGMYPKRVITGDARLAGIPVLPVDVNASAADWRVEPDGQIEGLRAGLREVKGISDAEVARIVAGRPYTSLRDFWERARVSQPVTERLVLVGAFDPLYTGPAQPTRRDLLARVRVLAGPARKPASSAMLPFGDEAHDGLGELIPAGELPELTAAERVEAELDILGIDISQHVISFYAGLLGELGVVRARDLHRCRSGAKILVAGVKTSTQTPAVRSGQRIIFATLDDGTGAVNLAFFESVQDRCAARVFGSWLLVVRGRVRRPGREGPAGGANLAVSVNATECWDLTVIEQIRRDRGMAGLRAAMAAGDVGAATRGRPAVEPSVYPTGFRISPYAETGSPGGTLKSPPRKLWHASQGSSGGWAGPGE
jgi:error-prone DNA polymerase